MAQFRGNCYAGVAASQISALHIETARIRFTRCFTLYDYFFIFLVLQLKQSLPSRIYFLYIVEKLIILILLLMFFVENSKFCHIRNNTVFAKHISVCFPRN